IRKAIPTTSPPSCSTRSAIAFEVPPVARTSSWMSARVPPLKASAWSSSELRPYSSAYSTPIVSSGSLPGRRAGTKPQPSRYAIAEPMKKPRASPPMTTSGCRSSAQSARRSIVCRNASWSASSGMMSLKTTPFSGQSGTSRILAFRSSTPVAAIRRSEVSEGAPEEELRELLRELRECPQIVQRSLTALGAARAEGRPDELLEQRCFAVGRGPERAQVARPDSERRELRTDGRDLGIAFCVPLLSPIPARLEQAVLLELTQ